MKDKLAIIGAGNMASSIVAGVLSTGLHSANDLLVTNRSHGKLERLAERWCVNTSYDNHEAAHWAGTIIVAVKPVDMQEALASLGGCIGGKLIISVAAGVAMSQVRSWLGDAEQPVVRVMPNTPAQVGEGMSAWVASGGVSEEQRERVRVLLRALGREIEMADESYLDQATAISGSGPAYLFYFAEMLIESARGIGLSDEEAHELVLQTIWGAAKMLREGAGAPGALRHAVTSKGGTTEAALAEFARGGMAQALDSGVQAAYRRGGEIRRQLSQE
jgi:pyrroline-5-carboxylate reductase